jgi:predicted dithiol-disulfide oxidoreductase (DUF899 family)
LGWIRVACCSPATVARCPALLDTGTAAGIGWTTPVTPTDRNAMQTHRIASHDEWLVARKAHLAKEKELTRLRDKLNAERRGLPWVRVEKTYVFDTRDGKKTLADLFEGRSQLIVQHFMFGPTGRKVV